MKKHNFTYDRKSLQLFNLLRQTARYEGYDTEAAAELDALEKKLQHNEDYDFKRWEKEIRRVVEAGIVERYYYESGRDEYELQTDKDVRQAIDMLHNRKQMHKILSGEPDAYVSCNLGRKFSYGETCAPNIYGLWQKKSSYPFLLFYFS